MLRHFHRALKADTAIHLAGVELCAVAALTGSIAFAAAPVSPLARLARLTEGEISSRAFTRVTASMDPAMMSLASRHEPAGPLSAWGLTGPAAGPGAGFDPESPEAAVIRLQNLSPEAAAIWNANNPVAATTNPAAQPFRLNAGGILDEARAVDCMTAAVYYEAAMESTDGQRAVAQVILNRMRHPAFPKTVCGVVFQGSNRKTGCQFSFTCDGSLGRQPSSGGWSRARQVAIASLNGYVMGQVGNATHYHANYVAPYWSPSLLKVGTIGAHIFYRWTGSWGLPPAFSGRYSGSEMDGMRIATLDALASQSQPLAGGVEKEAVLPVVEPTDVVVAEVAPRRIDPANPEAGGEALAEPELLTAAAAAKDAGEITKPEELDWAGRPKPKAPPRVAMPSRGMF